MKEGYGNFYTDDILIAKCKKEKENVDLGSEVSKVKRDNLLAPLYMDLGVLNTVHIEIRKILYQEYLT
jgi:hypothetical protein